VRVQVPPSAPAARPRRSRRVPNQAYRIAGVPIIIRRWLSPRPRRDDHRAVVSAAFAARYWRIRSPKDRKRVLRAWLLWPWLLLGLVIRFTRRNGATVARRHGRPVPLQVYDQLRFFFGLGILPRWYYIFSLYEREVAGQAHCFLHRYETKQGLFGLLNRGGSSPLNDKDAFADFCAQHGLPTAELILVASAGELQWQEGCSALPPVDLFLKPKRACGGKGAERWDALGADRYRSIGGEELDGAALLQRLRERSLEVPMLVQARLRNHPDLADLSNGALCTARVLTCLDERDEPEVVAAVFRMAIGRNVTVDNIHAGGIAAAVELESGVLGPASDLGDRAALGWLDVHPDTGAPIAGRTLAGWSEVRALAVAAHRAFRDRTVVGWDIALTPSGAVLVEGNSGPDVDLLQRPMRRGLGCGRLGVLLAHHLVKRGLVRVR
jgi:hypothetical protein